MTAADAEQMHELKKRDRMLNGENEVLRRAAAYPSQANLPGKLCIRWSVNWPWPVPLCWFSFRADNWWLTYPDFLGLRDQPRIRFGAIALYGCRHQSATSIKPSKKATMQAASNTNMQTIVPQLHSQPRL